MATVQETAEALASVIERMDFGALTQAQAAAELWVILAAFPPVADVQELTAQVIAMIGRMDGTLIGYVPPDPGLGTLGAVYIDLDGRRFYGPKTELGWGDGIPLLGAAGLDAKEVLIRDGILPPGATDAEFAEWLANSQIATVQPLIDAAAASAAAAADSEAAAGQAATAAAASEASAGEDATATAADRIASEGARDAAEGSATAAAGSEAAAAGSAGEAESAKAAAETAAAASAADAIATAEDRQATAADRVATGEDRGVADAAAGVAAGAAQASADAADTASAAAIAAAADLVLAQAARDLAQQYRDQALQYRNEAGEIVGGDFLTEAAADALYRSLAALIPMADVDGLALALAAKATPADIEAAIDALVAGDLNLLEARVAEIEAKPDPVLTVNGLGPDEDGNVAVLSGGVEFSAAAFNLPALVTSKSAAGIANVKANISDAVVFFVGDSNTAGAGASGAEGNTVLAYPNAFAAQLAAYASEAVPTSIRSRAGDADMGVEGLLNGADPTVDPGTWGFGPGATSGGKFFTASVNGALMTVTCPDPWDTLEVFYIRAASDTALSAGSLTLTGPNAETATVDAKTAAGTSQGPATLTLSRAVPAPGAVTFTANLDAGESFYVIGWIFKNSKARALHFVNGGIRAANTGNSNFTPIGLSRTTGFGYAGMDAIGGVWKPALTFIMVGTNDARLDGLNPGVATFKANTQLLINEAAKTGAVVLLVPPDIAPAVEGPVPFAQYRQALYELALSNGLALVDFQKVLGTHSESVANGTQKDNLHPNAAGHALMARALRQVIDTVLTGPAFASPDDIRAMTRADVMIAPKGIADAMAPVVVADAASIVLDLSKGSYFTLLTTAAVGAARTFAAPINGKPGQSFVVDITSDAANRTVAYNAVFKWDGGAVPAITTTSGRKDKLICQVTGAGTIDASLRKDVR